VPTWSLLLPRIVFREQLVILEHIVTGERFGQYAYCENGSATDSVVWEMGELCKGGMWQESLKAELIGFLL